MKGNTKKLYTLSRWFDLIIILIRQQKQTIRFHSTRGREREKRMNRTLIYGTLNFNRKTVESAAPNILTHNRKSFKTLLTSTANDEDLPHYLYFYLHWTEKKTRILYRCCYCYCYLYTFFTKFDSLHFSYMQLHLNP